MKPQRFHPDQKVICVSKGNIWYDIDSGEPSTGPIYNEIYTVRGYDGYVVELNTWFIFLEEFPLNDDSWPENLFEPVVEDQVLSEALNEIFEPTLI